MQGIQIEPPAPLQPETLLLLEHVRTQLEDMAELQESTDPGMTEAQRRAALLDMGRRLLAQIRSFTPTSNEVPQ